MEIKKVLQFYPHEQGFVVSGAGSDSKLVQNARRMFAVTLFDIVKFFCFLLPGGRKLMNAIGISIFKKEETLYFYDILKTSVEMRWVLNQYGHKLKPKSYCYSGKRASTDVMT